MSEQDKKEQKVYKISVSAYGGVEVQAPSKKHCIELFREVTTTKKEPKLKECIY